MEQNPSQTENKRKGALSFDKSIFQGTNKSNQSITDNYEVVQRLSQTPLKSIYELKEKSTGLNRICKVYENNPLNKKYFDKEANILRRLDHPNLIKLIETYEDKKFFYLIFEECVGPSLLDTLDEKLQQNQIYSESAASVVFMQIIQGLACLHENGICHRNINPKNILFVSKDTEHNLTVKICGFDKAKILTKEKRKAHSLKGNVYYSAPEVIYGDYDERSDIWSAGVVLYAMLSGELPFMEETMKEVSNKIRQIRYSFPEERWKDATIQSKELIQKMICDVQNRLSAKEIQKDVWFKLYKEKTENPFKAANFDIKKFENYVNSYKLKKLVFTYMSVRIQDEDVEKISQMFKKMDKDGSGNITFDEFKKVMKDYNIEEGQLKRMFDLADSNKNGTLEYSEFMAAMMNMRKDIKEEYYRQAFSALDLDGNGKISKEELIKILDVKDEKEKEVLRKIINKADINGDGNIDYDEFLAMMREDE